MAVTRPGRSIGNTILKIIMFIVIGGFILALLRAFNYDLFGIVDWLWNIGYTIINSIADFFSDNETFRKVTEEPAAIFF